MKIKVLPTDDGLSTSIDNTCTARLPSREGRPLSVTKISSNSRPLHAVPSFQRSGVATALLVALATGRIGWGAV
jgi:hypothetical protein